MGIYCEAERLKTGNWGGDTLVLPVIEAERIKHQMSREDLAKVLGVSKRTISNWQCGVTDLPLSKLLALAKLWKCTTDYLLGLDAQDSA